MAQRRGGEILLVEGALNVRDVGGYTAADGVAVAGRRFIRAGSLASLTASGRRALEGLGVDCVVDLRSEVEAREMPDALEPEGFRLYHIPMLDYIQSNISQGVVVFPDSMLELYMGLLDNDQEKFCQIFNIFADPGIRCVLYHCTAGKDRTGVTTMLLLALAGVADEDIVADYALSERMLSALRVDARVTAVGDVPVHVLQSKPETMRDTLDYLRARYGSAEHYLRRCGVSAETIDRLLQKLLG